jgi:hypothetical protein
MKLGGVEDLRVSVCIERMKIDGSKTAKGKRGQIIRTKKTRKNAIPVTALFSLMQQSRCARLRATRGERRELYGRITDLDRLSDRYTKNTYSQVVMN